MLDRHVDKLTRRISILEAEAEIRRLQARYMMLCDTPCPVFPPISDDERIELILNLYTEDAVWEGVGEYYGDQFGRAEGKEAIRTHFQQFWQNTPDSQLILNAHYLTSEHIEVSDSEEGVTAEGTWIHMQPWLYSDGRAILRSSRLNNGFRRVEGVMKIARTRTENVFVANLPNFFAKSYPQQSELFR